MINFARPADGLTWQSTAVGFTAGQPISIVTAPVGVSGAVFLLPVQLSVCTYPIRP